MLSQTLLSHGDTETLSDSSLAQNSPLDPSAPVFFERDVVDCLILDICTCDITDGGEYITCLVDIISVARNAVEVADGFNCFWATTHDT